MKSRSLRRAMLALSIAGLFGHSTFAADVTWDTSAMPGITGGSGTWDTTATNWTVDGGTTNILWNNLNNDTAIFGDVGGAVALGAPITAAV
jgi:hypothetical protein